MYVQITFAKVRNIFLIVASFSLFLNLINICSYSARNNDGYYSAQAVL